MSALQHIKSNMYFLHFEVTPNTNHPKKDVIAGAFVNCWIEASSRKDAIDIARKQIIGDHWIVGEPDQDYEVDRSSYDKGDKGLEYYEQALIDKNVCVFHTWPIDEDDD